VLDSKRELRAISSCNQALMRAVDEQMLLNDICRIVCDEAGYRMAWVGFAENDAAKTIRPVAWAGAEDGYLAQAGLTWADTERGRGPSGTAIRGGKTAFILNFDVDPLAAPWREGASQRGYRSTIALPLKDQRGETFGVMTMYSAEVDAFTADEVRLLEALANDLAFGVMVLRDRVERKRVDDSLRESEQRYRRLFENSPVSLWEEDFSQVKAVLDGLRTEGVTDLEAYLADHPGVVQRCASLVKVVEVNRAALTLHRAASREELLAGLVKTFTPESFDTFTRELVCLWNGRTELTEEAIVKTLSGEPRDVTVYFSVNPGDEATLSRVLVSLTDITEGKLAERERQAIVRRLNQQLEQRVTERTVQLEAANTELESFAYSVSHDLRAPLRHISGFLELLKRRLGATLDEKSLHYMATVTDAATRMDVLIEDLLGFSRMSRKEMAESQVDLNALVAELVQEFEDEWRGRDVHWHLGELPTVTGDRAMLRVALGNLVSNALKFTRPRAQASIEIGCAPGNETETIIFVRDNGVGFEMQYAGKLFGVFQRLHLVSEFEGTGIGLANVRRIIQRHGGRTWAEGKLDGGAALYLSLPKATGARRAPPE